MTSSREKKMTSSNQKIPAPVKVYPAPPSAGRLSTIEIQASRGCVEVTPAELLAIVQAAMKLRRLDGLASAGLRLSSSPFVRCSRCDDGQTHFQIYLSDKMACCFDCGRICEIV